MVQGNAGGQSIADPVRGPLNTGGLFGERNRWHLPGFSDGGWQTRRVLDTTAVAGTSWHGARRRAAVPGQLAWILIAGAPDGSPAAGETRYVAGRGETCRDGPGGVA